MSTNTVWFFVSRDEVEAFSTERAALAYAALKEDGLVYSCVVDDKAEFTANTIFDVTVCSSPTENNRLFGHSKPKGSVSIFSREGELKANQYGDSVLYVALVAHSYDEAVKKGEDYLRQLISDGLVAELQEKAKSAAKLLGSTTSVLATEKLTRYGAR